MMAGAALSMAVMEERPLAGPERDQVGACLNKELLSETRNIAAHPALLRFPT